MRPFFSTKNTSRGQVTQFSMQDSATQTTEHQIVELKELLEKHRGLQAELSMAKSTITFLRVAAPMEHERTAKMHAEEVCAFGVF